MLFNEIYGKYFSVVADVLKEAVNGTLSGPKIADIVREKAFAESVLNIPAALKSGEWPLLLPDMTTKIQNAPTMPLTTLQKRWMKALLSDPRVKLFSPSVEGLEDVEPLYTQDSFTYFDRYADGDPYDDPAYIEHFHTILTALRENRKLSVKSEGLRKTVHKWICIPHRMEYSEKDDKFRLIAMAKHIRLTVNIARVSKCSLADPWTPDERQALNRRDDTLVLELIDERNALERTMLHFSHLEKETERMEDNRYRVTLRYQRDDETELLIRVLSFGPLIRVISPERFIEKIRERLNKQMSCGL
ncbi:hypothetical protein AGMMS50276_03130 [Synergistales bacterium]|nr:hypothetical protein AGMMS50276_03130 [Synergistales bacterium]